MNKLTSRKFLVTVVVLIVGAYLAVTERIPFDQFLTAAALAAGAYAVGEGLADSRR